MLNNLPPVPLQVRHRCRNPRCGGHLKPPAANLRDAFCCRGCEALFYNRHCRACEGLFSPKTSRRAVCSRAECQSAFRRHPEDFFGARYPYRGVTHNGARSPRFTGLKIGIKPGRPYRVVAGPGAGLHPVNLRVDLSTLPRVNAWPTRAMAPVNIIGGYKFPNAPKIDLGLATSRAPAGRSDNSDPKRFAAPAVRGERPALRVPAGADRAF
jgi:hypothetical protein